MVMNVKEAELWAVNILQDPFSGPSARFDAENMLMQLGWSKLAIALAKVKERME